MLLSCPHMYLADDKKGPFSATKDVYKQAKSSPESLLDLLFKPFFYVCIPVVFVFEVLISPLYLLVNLRLGNKHNN